MRREHEAIALTAVSLVSTVLEGTWGLAVCTLAAIGLWGYFAYLDDKRSHGDKIAVDKFKALADKVDALQMALHLKQI